MFVIVGLGNPGAKYKNNRHNTGFMFIDYLISQFTNYQPPITNHQSPTTNHQIILFKPQTFMNRSGEAVKKITDHYSLNTKQLIVAHDDLDIPLGKFRIQQKTGPRLHNGLESIENALGKKDFWRVRIGIDNRKPDNWIDGETYVLQDFQVEEKKVIHALFPKILNQLETQNFIHP